MSFPDEHCDREHKKDENIRESHSFQFTDSSTCESSESVFTQRHDFDFEAEELPTNEMIPTLDTNIAIPVPNATLILDGIEIDNDEIQTARKSEYSILGFCVVCFMCYIALNYTSFGRPKKTGDFSKIPTPVPTVTFAPTTHYLYSLKELVIPISGEDKLDDPTTIQHFVWHRIGAAMPKLISESIMDEKNNSWQMVQRYLQTVVHLSIIGDPEPTINHILDHDIVFGAKCDKYVCNDDGEITVIDTRNHWSTSRGRGTIAKEIGYLPKLTHILLSRNAMRGTIPTEIGMLGNLITLDVRENYLTGTIPTELGRCKNLELLYLYSNKLKGEIPSDMGNLASMKYMNLSANLLTGSIPERFDSFMMLEGLSLQYNELFGNIEFLCDKNYTLESYANEVVFNSMVKYSYIVDQCLIVDCVQVECSCCKCS